MEESEAWLSVWISRCVSEKTFLPSSPGQSDTKLAGAWIGRVEHHPHPMQTSSTFIGYSRVSHTKKEGHENKM